MEIVINIDHPDPLFTQLIEQIKQAVQTGRLRPGDPLPSIRQIANDLDFLDATIMSLYFQLTVLLSIGHILRNMRLEDIDFGLYKDTPAT